MGPQELPLEFVLRRSVTEGVVKPDDPELARLRASRDSRRLLLKDEDDFQRNAVPLSQNPSIYNQRIGLQSTIRRDHSPISHTINNHRNSPAPGLAAGSGYGLDDYTTSEEEDYAADDCSYDTSDSEEAMYAVAPSRRAKKQDSNFRGSEQAHYVAHITGRIDPWEMQMQKLQEEGKELAPVIAERITNDFKNLEETPTKSVITWARDNEDVTQRIKSMSLETEAIKDRRKREAEAKNQALAKDIESCLARIKEERDTAIRVRDEALKQAQMEKERVAKEEEEKIKAAAAEKEAKSKRASEAAAAAAEKAKQVVIAAAERASSNTSAIFVSEAGNAEYQNYTKVLDQIRQVVLPTVAANPALKKYCNSAKREMVADLGQLVNKQSEIFRVATDIDNIFKRTMQSQNENAYMWVMNCTAKKLVKQAETEALVKSAPVFPLAHVAVLLFSNHQIFLDVLMARFAKKCPYVTPMYIAKGPNDSADEFMQKLAYKKTGSGWETEAQYNARQCAMFTLYCAIMQTTPPVGQNKYPLTHGWTWMARIVNMPPRPITPSLITVFLEVCGNSYLRTYRNQAAKVLKLVADEFIPLIPRQGVDGTTRLKTLLEEYFRTGNIPVADGRDYGR
ncbi:GLE1-like protein-domain-containing protein [Dissophora ornata]|nr:hypothetical protein BGZ58_008674 [Dissophora ornata]KAI8602522.1 GLE1-like protein-domain-containing protein [Dissophora ornata]